jgi:TetR/AcrR family tetracycline transcriptional repressor
VTLSRAQVVDGAYSVLRGQGLAGLSMRAVAGHLGVQPGALYYYVPNKQELLVEVAARILDDAPRRISTTDARAAAIDLRACLSQVRDGAEVVSFVQAFRPEALVPVRALDALFVDRLTAPRATWAARTLVHFVLGFVAEEQNRAELVRTRAMSRPGCDDEADEAFEFGLDAVVGGVEALARAG